MEEEASQRDALVSVNMYLNVGGTLYPILASSSQNCMRKAGTKMAGTINKVAAGKTIVMHSLNNSN